MKIAFILFFVYFNLNQADVYYITFIRGAVQLESSGKILKAGDKVTPKDRLIFKDKSSKVSCISPTKGRFDITPGLTPPNAKGEWLAIISSKLVPSSSYQRLSTRSLSNDTGYDPLSFFKSVSDKPIVLLTGTPLTIRESYAMDEQNFFFVQYEHQGKTIARKVHSSGQSLIFRRELFSDSNGNLIDPASLKHVMLCYQGVINSTPKSTRLINFHPLLLEKDELQKEIEILYEYLKPLKSNNLIEIHEEILAHLDDNYGQVNSIEIEKQFLKSLK